MTSLIYAENFEFENPTIVEGKQSKQTVTARVVFLYQVLLGIASYTE